VEVREQQETGNLAALSLGKMATTVDRETKNHEHRTVGHGHDLRVMLCAVEHTLGTPYSVV